MTDIITRDRTWQQFGDDGLAEEILGVRAGTTATDVTVCFDLSQQLNPDTSLSSAVVAESGTSDLTIDSPAVDGYKIEVQMTGFVAETVYLITLKVSASDSTGTDVLNFAGRIEAY